MRTRAGLAAVVATSALFVLTLGIPATATVGAVTVHGLVPNAQPYGVTIGNDGAVWFTEDALGELGRIDPAGVETDQPAAAPGSYTTSVTIGPDGNLWFASEATDEVGYYDVSTHTVQTYPTGANSGPAAITLGPDGNLWFTEFSADKIGTITPDGSVLHAFPVAKYAAPWGITTGPDGRLWFTENAGNAIGAITTAGKVTEYRLANLGDGGAYPAGITTGPDGNLWFGEMNRDAVGRINTTGSTIKNVTIRTGAAPTFITPGFDRQLWFTENSLSGAVGSITPTGTWAEHGQTSTAAGISAGIDGNLWLAAPNGDSIDMVKDADAGTAYELVRDPSYVPATRTVTQGLTVKWMFVGPRMESVTDASGMHLYDSGAHSFVTYFSHRFNAAGTYTYHSTTGAPMVGTVSVPIQLAPGTGSQTTTFTVTCSAGVTPSGFGYDIQVRRPGSSSYVDWKIGATKRAVAFVPDGGKGTYSFRSRLVKLSDGTHTDWSPAASISVS